jgi:LmbE family N-acetylglucosaminyl deacetylase
VKVLAISPHTDDVEFGAGAYLARLAREGAIIHIGAFSYCGDEELLDEFREAAWRLGTKLLSYDEIPVREFADHRQRILDAMIQRRDSFQPDLVLCPSRADYHQDHRVVAEEAVRAFRGISTLGYILPWNCPTVAANAWRVVTADDVERKVAAVGCYVSQKDRPYARVEAIRAGVVQAGLQVGAPLAEAFEVIRWVS